MRHVDLHFAVAWRDTVTLLVATVMLRRESVRSSWIHLEGAARKPCNSAAGQHHAPVVLIWMLGTALGKSIVGPWREPGRRCSEA
jgi:hypothetical protein